MSGARDWGCRCTPLCACFPALTSLGDEGPFTPTVHTLTLAPHPPVSTWTHARVHVTCIAHMPSYSHPPAPTRPPARRRPRPTASASWELSAPAPCALMSWWWLEIGRRGSIYTTGTGKFLHSRLHPPHKHLHPSVHTCPPLRLYKSTRPHTYLGPQVYSPTVSPGRPPGIHAALMPTDPGTHVFPSPVTLQMLTPIQPLCLLPEHLPVWVSAPHGLQLARTLTALTLCLYLSDNRES